MQHRRRKMFNIFNAAIIFSILHYGQSVEESVLNEWREKNAASYELYSSILHSRIRERHNDPTRIEWLTTTDVILTIEREINLSFNFQLPLVVPENLDEIIMKLRERKRDWSLKKSHINTLSTLKDLTVSIKKIYDSLADKEFVHHKNYMELKDFFLLLNSKATCATNYDDKQLRKVKEALRTEYKAIVDLRAKIINKTYGLRDCIDNRNVFATAVEIYALKKQIHEMVLGTSFKEDAIKAELGPKIVELDRYVKEFGDFLKDKSVTNFSDVDKHVDMLEKGLHKLSKVFLDTLKKSASSIEKDSTESLLESLPRMSIVMQNTLNERRRSNTEHFKDYTSIIVKKMQSGTCDENVSTHDLSTLYEILAMDHDIFHAFDIKISGLIDDNLESLKGKKLSEKGKIEMRLVERYATYTKGQSFYNTISDTMAEHISFNADSVQNFKATLQHEYESIKKQREAILRRTHDLRNTVEDSMTTALDVNYLLGCINNAVVTNDKNVISMEDHFFKELEPIINKLNKEFTDSSHVNRFIEVDEHIKSFETSEDNLFQAMDALVQ